MNGTVRILLALVTALTLSGCASRMTEVQQQEPELKADEALIVFLRTDQARGYASVMVYDITNPEIQFIGVIEPLTKVTYSVKPGKYVFMVLATSTAFMEATVVAGKRYSAMITP